MRCNGSNWAVYSPGSWDGFRNDVWALWAGVIMRLEHHLVGGYVRYISPHIIIIIIWLNLLTWSILVCTGNQTKMAAAWSYKHTSSSSTHFSCTSSQVDSTASMVCSLFCHLVTSSRKEPAALLPCMLWRATWWDSSSVKIGSVSWRRKMVPESWGGGGGGM